MRSPDLTGYKFGRLTVIRRSEGYKWECRCVCGNSCVRLGSQLQRFQRLNRRQSCGCWKNELAVERRRAAATHGLTTIGAGIVSNKLYDVWRQMLRRCENPLCKDFPAYGGRGIKICDAWHDGRIFVKWCLDSGYQEGLTLERQNVNGNYEPANCTWIPNKLQAKNLRKNIILEFSGKTLCLSDWSRLLGIHIQTLLGRYRRGWTIERILSEPPVIGKNQFG